MGGEWINSDTKYGIALITWNNTNTKCELELHLKIQFVSSDIYW